MRSKKAAQQKAAKKKPTAKDLGKAEVSAALTEMLRAVGEHKTESLQRYGYLATQQAALDDKIERELNAHLMLITQVREANQRTVGRNEELRHSHLILRKELVRLKDSVMIVGCISAAEFVIGAALLAGWYLW